MRVHELMVHNSLCVLFSAFLTEKKINNTGRYVKAAGMI